MKKGYYIHMENCGSSGVMKKISMQIKAFSTEFSMEKILIKTLKRSLLQKIMGLLIWNSMEREYDNALKKMNNPDFVYIRRTYVDKKYLEFLKNLKERFPTCKIIVEIPVYPYKGEMMSNFYTILMYLKEVVYRHRYKEYIDRFVTYSDDTEICGVKTINTMNGVDVASISEIQRIENDDQKVFNLIAVAMLAKHHGYERIIEGLKNYYEKKPVKKIVLHIVGEGKEGEKYRSLTDKYNLNNYVKFYGAKYNEELDEIYNFAHAGIAAFGVYKEGFSNLNTIKAREYLAKGLPVILGAEDNLFDENNPYGLLFPNDSSAINIQKVVDYLENIYQDKDINNKIRKYAFKRVDNTVTLKPVIQYILEE